MAVDSVHGLVRNHLIRAVPAGGDGRVWRPNDRRSRHGGGRDDERVPDRARRACWGPYRAPSDLQELSILDAGVGGRLHVPSGSHHRWLPLQEGAEFRRRLDTPVPRTDCYHNPDGTATVVDTRPNQLTDCHLPGRVRNVRNNGWDVHGVLRALVGRGPRFGRAVVSSYQQCV